MSGALNDDPFLRALKLPQMQIINALNILVPVSVVAGFFFFGWEVALGLYVIGEFVSWALWRPFWKISRRLDIDE